MSAPTQQPTQVTMGAAPSTSQGMGRGFYIIMAAQFFSSLADNALYIAAIELLRSNGSPEWQKVALIPMFAFFYVVLAPFVGAFADFLPKGKVMLISNTIKVVGCVSMLFGMHPLLAYCIVGLGAAAYSPAKYGILTEMLPPSQLVKANGWIEGLTIASIILGVVVGGQLVGQHISSYLLAFDMPGIDTGINTPAEAAIALIMVFYAIAAFFNLFIPHTGVVLKPFPSNPAQIVSAFWADNSKLWKDKLGQISLATTTLFWGVSGNLRYIVLAWAAVALSFNTTKAATLVGVVAIGTAFGAVIASFTTKLDKAVGVIPLGIGMGIIVLAMNFISNVWVAIPFLIVLGALGGYLVVPMNALLQHRGHNLMGAGQSIAVQNFNEQFCILLIGALYASSTKIGVNAYGAITGFGLIVAGVMTVIYFWQKSNEKKHAAELERLYEVARNDAHHH